MQDDESNEDAFRPATTSSSKDIDTTALPSRSRVEKQFGSVGEGSNTSGCTLTDQARRM